MEKRLDDIVLDIQGYSSYYHFLIPGAVQWLNDVPAGQRRASSD